MGETAEKTRSLDAKCTDNELKDYKELIRLRLETALDNYCAGRIRFWNEKMDKYVQKMWRKAYLNDFKGPEYQAVFEEVLAFKQRQLDPNEYKR